MNSQSALLQWLVTGLLLLLTGLLQAQPESPTGLLATAYDHHIELNWDQSPEPGLSGYRIYGKPAGTEQFTFLGSRSVVDTRFIHFTGQWDAEWIYRITAVKAGLESAPSAESGATTFRMTDEQLLDMVQAYTFRYFWEFAHPVSGLARERNTTDIVTTGGSGFGIMAIIVGAERGFVSYDQALTRMNKITDFLLAAPRFRGAFAHWMNGATGAVVPFSSLDNGGDLVETAFLIQGLLCARQYFTGDSPAEVALREKITTLWEDVNWNFYRKQVGNVLYWHWSPEHQFAINLPIRGFNETHIVYLLAVAAPDPAHDIPPSLYHSGWAGGNYPDEGLYYGYPLSVGPAYGGPLFFAHYSYLGFDPRGRADAYANYFVRNTHHALIHRMHAIVNPYNREGYGADCWGLTASDDPFVGYLAHEPRSSNLDNGTIAPTAALASMPYTPEYSMDALKYFYRELGEELWGPYGFYDAFNPGAGWFADSYLAIDQGPIIGMIENYRTGLLWDLFMANPEIEPALTAVGFVPDTTTIDTRYRLPAALQEPPLLYPNPAATTARVALTLTRPALLSWQVTDATGRTVLKSDAPLSQTTGLFELMIPTAPLRSGHYRLVIYIDGYPMGLPLLVP